MIDPRETIRAVAADVRAGESAGRDRAPLPPRDRRARRWRRASRLAAAHGTELVVLSGGVFQNRRLLEAVVGGLDAAGLRVLVPERLPVNDGGISYGQAAVAAATRGMTDEPTSELDRILDQEVFIRGANRPFGELTPDQARARADELRAATAGVRRRASRRWRRPGASSRWR